MAREPFASDGVLTADQPASRSALRITLGRMASWSLASLTRYRSAGGSRLSSCLVKQQMQLVMAIKRVKEDTIISVS